MANKINFITGESYSLADLFSRENQIIIPDLQRDYCWGDMSHTQENKELVSGFVNRLIDLYQEEDSSKLNLGLIYGYESPLNHIQLCDGQQRLTTLYLLIGMLNRFSRIDAFRSYLISEYELEQDDREPYLRYSIRESSLYFMSDLVCNIFITNGESIDLSAKVSEQIKQSKWYFNEYDVDPSISSILRALDIIQTILQERQINVNTFGKFILNELTFMYYDMISRQNGEETFVVINTTGEPLSTTQNLKPLVITAEINKNYAGKISREWEKMETWFWNHRCIDNGNDTADAGFNEFLRWVTIIYYVSKGRVDEKESNERNQVESIVKEGKYTFPIDKIPFEHIYSMWKALKTITCSESSKIEKMTTFLSPPINTEGMNAINQNDCFRLLPILAYVEKRKCQKWDKNVERLYQFIDNLLRIDNVNKSINALVFEAVWIGLNCEDIIDLEGNTGISRTILTAEELAKIHIYYCCKGDVEKRERIEKAFWTMQANNIFNGEIFPLLKWSTSEESFDFALFEHYAKLFDSIFVEPCEDNIDTIRRILLTYNLDNYPRIFKGYSNLCFGWEYWHWKLIINDNLDLFKMFFDDYARANSIDALFDERKNLPTNQLWLQPFINNDFYLQFCRHKNIQKINEHIIVLLLRDKKSADYRILIQGEILENDSYWNNWQIWGYNCLYTDLSAYNLALDILFDENSYKFRIFARDDDDNIKKQPFDFEAFIQEYPIFRYNQDENKWYSQTSISYNDILNEIAFVQQGITSFISHE